ncbi:MAG: HRDC domain-containing protein, partial [Gemmatimonadetes bacterium]|nr:HRDC domain-containing protein [Gemmatimonadota bacterium]
PTREEEERMDRLKAARNRRADELGLDRGLLVPNAVLMEIARRAPRSEAELAEVPSLKRWQQEAAGAVLLEAAGDPRRR